MKQTRAYSTALLCATVLASSGICGCAATSAVSVREVPNSPLVDRLKLLDRGGPQASTRTVQTLRRYHVDQVAYESSSQAAKLQEMTHGDHSPESYHAVAELSYIGGRRVEETDPKAALDLYGASVANSYLYLFDRNTAFARNPYDPQFREACDLYNGALEAALRIVKQQGQLLPGCTHQIETATQTWNVTVVSRGLKWEPDDFERFEFVSDYEVQGLTNQYRTYGLGVPLIAVRKPRTDEANLAKYYPPGLSFPVTAFLRLVPKQSPAPGTTTAAHTGEVFDALLELYDPATTAETVCEGVRVPLESDLTTPLAYFLDRVDPQQVATLGLLNPQQGRETQGLYLVQPYEPHKIPVVMIHGLWSTPFTWMEMFNDLRGSREIRDNYQFWFYAYPTGQPFWYAAADFRDNLANLREILDPLHRDPALDQTVLVGHSMGGLVARLQAMDSRNELWNLVSDQPFHLVSATDQDRAALERILFFGPNPGIRRIVTIGTPHRGSSYANSTTRWLGRKLIELPEMMLQRRTAILRDNRELLKDPRFLEIDTSIDALSPDAPIYPVLEQTPLPPWVKHHNIVGVVDDESWLNRLSGDGDGVVEYASAHLENVASEIVVEADHTHVHQHPLAVLEVRRILLDHLHEISQPAPQRPQIEMWKASHEATTPFGVRPAGAERPLPAAPQAPVRPGVSVYPPMGGPPANHPSANMN